MQPSANDLGVFIFTPSHCPTRRSKSNNLFEQPLAEDLALSIGVSGELVEVDMSESVYPQAACLLVRREPTELIDWSIQES
jgi:hypothetical protein